MRLMIGEREVDCVTITGLAKLCGRKSSTLRKMEETGVLPPANFRTPSTETSKGIRQGFRVYTQEFAVRVASVIKNEIHRGIPVSASTKQKINQLFEEERYKYLNDA